MKSVEEIYQELMAQFCARTGLSAPENGDLAVRFYAVAAQLYSLYVQAEWTQMQCFPQTARGEYLDRHGALRGVKRREAEPAAGVLRFYVEKAREEAVKVEAGTVCMTADQARFVTTRAGAVEAGTLYADIPARAVEAGEQGNVAAGTVLNMAVAPTAISACVNPYAFAGGRDREDDESLRARIMETFARLANGANAAYYKLAALSFDEVVAAHVVPRSRGVGTVDVVIATEAGVPDENLLRAVEEYIQAMREIAVDVKVQAPETVPVEVELNVKAAPGADAGSVAARVEEAVCGWFTGTRLGQSVLTAQLNALVFALDGVENCTVVLPQTDVQVPDGALPVLGGLTVTAE